MITISAEQTERVQKILANIPGGAEKALSSAMNRGLAQIKTTASRKVRETYTTTASAINTYTKIQTKNLSAGNLAGYVSYSGTKIPLYKFKVSPKTPGTGRTVSVSVKKGEGGTMRHAFVQQMTDGYGHIGVFERKGKARLPITEKVGLAMAQMAANNEVTDEIEKRVQETIDKRVEHEISRILNGYGG